MFAKLYGDDTDQVLVMIDTDDEDCPCVRFSIKPEGLGVCSFGVSFEDTDEGQKQAESFFSRVTEESARKVVAETFDSYLPILRGE